MSWEGSLRVTFKVNTMKIYFLFLLFGFVLNCVTASYDTTKFVAKSCHFAIPSDKGEGEFLREVSSAKSSRISGGNGATNTQFPYAVEVNTRWSDGMLDVCTGAILSTTYIITARECI